MLTEAESQARKLLQQSPTATLHLLDWARSHLLRKSVCEVAEKLHSSLTVPSHKEIETLSSAALSSVHGGIFDSVFRPLLDDLRFVWGPRRPDTRDSAPGGLGMQAPYGKKI